MTFLVIVSISLLVLGCLTLAYALYFYTDHECYLQGPPCNTSQGKFLRGAAGTIVFLGNGAYLMYLVCNRKKRQSEKESSSFNS